MRRLTRALMMVVVLPWSGGASATLVDRGGGLIYDDVLNITWTQNANLWGQTGSWEAAVEWADALVFGGFDDWRLASMSVAGGLPTGSAFSVIDCSTATEAACRDNELGYMHYHNLGGSAGDDLRGSQGPFTNIQFTNWSGTAYPALSFAWDFIFGDGSQSLFVKPPPSAAWAVRPGDALAAPAPATGLLLTTGLVSFGLSRRCGRPRR